MQLRKLFSFSLVLALVGMISMPARAELLKNFKTDGSIEVRALSIDNESDRNGTVSDYRAETRTRILVGGSFDLLDDVHARVLLRKNNRLYGQGSENVNGVETALSVDNAYAKIDKVFNHVDLTMGRQFYGNADDLVIYFGPINDDILSVTALDIFRADTDIMGFVKIAGIAGKLVESTNGAAPYVTNPGVPADSNTDTDLWGLNVNTDKVIPDGNIAAYYYTQQVKMPTALGNNTIIVYGAKVSEDIKFIGLGYAAEYAQNGGRNNSLANTPGYRGNAYSLAVKFAKELGIPLRAKAEYARGSADFQAIASDRRFGKIFGEHTNAAGALGQAGVANLKVFAVTLGADPISKLGVDVGGYRFMSDRANATGNSSLGTEYDLILSWRHSANVTLETSVARLMVGNANQNPAGTPTSPITRLGADVKVKF